MLRAMKRLFAIAAAVVLLTFAGGCRKEKPSATPTPAATDPITGRIMGPAGDAQDTVDQLNEQQEQQEQINP
jgi:hypothetical protein